MFKTPGFTYDAAEGLSLQGDCVSTSPRDWYTFPRLQASLSESSEAALFFPWGEGMSVRPSLPPLEVEVPISPYRLRGVPPEWRRLGPLRPPPYLPPPALDMAQEPASLLILDR